MKKIASYMTLLLMTLIFAACSDDFAQPPVSLPEGGLGTGLWNDPYRTSQLANGGKGNDIWVTGYIVGWIDTSGDNFKMSETTCTFNDKATLTSNILLAGKADETNWENCVPVALTGDARDALNLMNNPGNLGKQVTIKCSNIRYFSQNSGLKEITAFNWGAEGIEEETPDTPSTGSDIFYADTKNNALNQFTFDHGTLPEGLTFVWKVDTKYGLVASAYANSNRYDSDAWAISPVINLDGYKSAALNFRWAANYFGSQETFLEYCQVAVRLEGGEWEKVEVPNPCSGTAFTFVDSGNIDLSKYAGKKIQLGFNYKSTPTVCGTFEVDQIKVTGEK